MKKLLLFSACLLLTACSSRPASTTSGSRESAAMATDSDLQNVRAKFPDLTLAKLEMGRMSFEENCQTCHALKDPTDFTEDRLRTIVPIMSKKTNDKAGQTVIDLEDQDLIMKYMVTISMRN